MQLSKNEIIYVENYFFRKALCEIYKSKTINNFIVNRINPHMESKYIFLNCIKSKTQNIKKNMIYQIL
ncbi:hypothetical protein BMW23_0775 [Bodo saltans virus]|uniref:Uncharacterized protein n=1 Tax=Bodo saltans virus TaxID=2024608 RepID=A0A2H4UV73_9VIRU|nr:hypothetical protein QJ851_gp0758 [Bodo saltans virus]ATZ80821.1 hypothetical protein BMW23_0775 [Bodo saltans virus]